jgi:hypothetical protein
MIKGLIGNQGVVVSGGNTSVPYVSQNNANPMQGMIRIWGSDMQVFDGNNWMTMSTSYATVSLDQEVLDIIQWARTQRQMEMNRKTLIANNPALKNAWIAIQKAEANFDILSKFVENDEEEEWHEGMTTVSMGP